MAVPPAVVLFPPYDPQIVGEGVFVLEKLIVELAPPWKTPPSTLVAAELLLSPPVLVFPPIPKVLVSLPLLSVPVCEDVIVLIVPVDLVVVIDCEAEMLDFEELVADDVDFVALDVVIAVAVAHVEENRPRACFCCAEEQESAMHELTSGLNLAHLHPPFCQSVEFIFAQQNNLFYIESPASHKNIPRRLLLNMLA